MNCACDTTDGVVRAVCGAHLQIIESIKIVAVSEERERCAKIAETVVGDFERDTAGRTEAMVRRGIADAIRKGK